MHRGDVKKPIRLTVGVGGCLNVSVCVFARGHSVSVGTVWYPVRINVWVVRIVVEPTEPICPRPSL